MRSRLADTIVVAVSALVVVCCGSEDYAAEPGTETGPCFKNGTCNAGLVCASDRCVRLDSADGGGIDGGGNTGDTGGTTTGDGASGSCEPPERAPPIKCGALPCSGGDACCIEQAQCVSGSSSCTGSAMSCVSPGDCGGGDEVCCADASIGSAGECPVRVVSVEGTTCRSSCAASELQLCFGSGTAGCNGGKTCVGGVLVVNFVGFPNTEIEVGVCR
jgi:hypothetical protein